MIIVNEHAPDGMLFIDTCALLDLVRLPIRPTDFKRELQAVTELLKQATLSRIALSISTVTPAEYYRNELSVIEEVRKHLKNACKTAEQISSFAMHIGAGDIDSRIDIELFVSKVSESGQTALRACRQVDATTDDELVAYRRMASGLRPAQRGKDSLGDCTVYAQLVRVASSIRANSQSPIVFLTSNTKDFSASNKLEPHSDIEEDFTSSRIKLVTNWSWALREIQSPPNRDV